LATDAAVLAAIDAAFGPIPKPEHFTNFKHCDECAAHDELLTTRDRNTLQIQDVGYTGWDPLCFSSPDGIAYYMPALVRLALAPPTDQHGWYGDQLLFHLFSHAAENKFYKFCSEQQRRAVAMLLEHFVSMRTVVVDSLSGEDEFVRARKLWSSGI
jgi:hypothetical protein